MDEFLNRLWIKGNTPYVRAFGLFLIILLAELGLVSTVSSIGFSTEVQNYRSLLGIAAPGIAFLIAAFWLVMSFRKPKNIFFLRNTQDGKLYLKDFHGKAREIPDADTHFYLVEALGITNAILDVSPGAIKKIRGEKLITPKKWERPLTEDEKSTKELRYKVSSELEKLNVSFTQNVSPQRIVIQVANRGKNLIHFRDIKFQPYRLSDESLSSSYHRIDASYISIPFRRSKANLEAGESVQIEMELRQKWRRPDIDKIRGELGFMVFDVTYEGKKVDGIIMTV